MFQFESFYPRKSQLADVRIGVGHDDASEFTAGLIGFEGENEKSGEFIGLLDRQVYDIFARVFVLMLRQGVWQCEAVDAFILLHGAEVR